MDDIPLHTTFSSSSSSLLVVDTDNTVVGSPTAADQGKMFPDGEHDKSTVNRGTDVHDTEHDTVHHEDDFLCFLGDPGLVDEEKDFPLYDHRMEFPNVSPLLSTLFPDLLVGFLFFHKRYECFIFQRCFALLDLGRTRIRKSYVFR